MTRSCLGTFRQSVQPDRLPDDVADVHARIERREGILEDDLHLAAQPAHVGWPEIHDGSAFIADIARRRLDQSQERAAERGLAAPGFAHDGECLAALHRNRDAVDRSHDRGGRQRGRRHRKCFTTFSLSRMIPPWAAGSCDQLPISSSGAYQHRAP